MEQMMTPQQEQERSGRQSRRRHRPGLVWAALGCSVAALALACAALWMAWPGQEAGPPPEPEPVPAAEPVPTQYITYRGHQLPIDEGVAVNAWNPQAFVTEEGRIAYRTQELTALPGIDVSSHQGEIDWEQVAGAGMEFAMIRAGFRGYGQQGTLNLDEQFHSNIRGALDAGLDVGVYFFSQATNVWEAEEEAELLLEELEGYAVAYPVVFDWERIHNNSARTDGVPGKTVSLMAQAFCGKIAQAGYIPGVYFNQDMAYLELDLGDLEENVFWLAEYDDRPEFYYHFDLWQYSSKGQIPGVSTPVDLNLSFRDFGAEKEASVS